MVTRRWSRLVGVGNGWVEGVHSQRSVETNLDHNIISRAPVAFNVVRVLVLVQRRKPAVTRHSKTIVTPTCGHAPWWLKPLCDHHRVF